MWYTSLRTSVLKEKNKVGKGDRKGRDRVTLSDLVAREGLTKR